MKTLLRNLLVILLSLTISQKLTAQCNGVGNGTDGGIYYLYADTNIDDLCLGGNFITSGADTLNHCGFCNDTSFIPLGMTGYYGTDDSVWCILYFNGNMYYGGSFINAGGTAANYIALWDGSAWHPVGNGFNGTVRCLAAYQGNLYAGGEFTMSGVATVNHLAEWTGTQWVQPGNGLNNAAYTMYTWNGNLYIGGSFTSAGSTPANYICAWNGSAYTALGSGLTFSMMRTPAVYALSLYKGELWAGGMFDHAGSIGASNLAKWDGSNWSSAGDIGTGMNSDAVWALCVYDSALYAGGSFGMCGSQSASNIGAWDGSNWSTIGTGFNGTVHALAVYHKKLYLGGLFTSAAGTTVSNIASYDRITGIIPSSAKKDVLKLYPNPAHTSFTVSWSQNINAPPTFKLYDITGNKVLEKNLGTTMAGNHIITIDAHNLNAGIYIYSFNTGNSLYNGKVSLIK